jgi:hypothetical protein
VLGTDVCFLLSSGFHAVPWSIHGDTDIHSEDAHIRVILYASYFNMFFYAESKVALLVKSFEREIWLSTTGRTFLRKSIAACFLSVTTHAIDSPFRNPKSLIVFLAFFLTGV